jgi:hypothetical protein
MKSLERRIQKIEELLPQLPCPNPEHAALRIFVYGVTPEQDRQNDELVESIKNCEYCKAREATSKGPSIIKFGRFANSNADAPPTPPAQRPNVQFIIGDT